MYRVLVREGKNGTIADLLQVGFFQHGIQAVFTDEGERAIDAEVFAPLAEKKNAKLYDGSCRAVIVFGEDWPHFSDIKEDRVIITYGLSSRDTLTYSSNKDGIIVVCVQREFPALTGEMVIRQERSFPAGENRKALEQLAVCACMLVCGI